MIWLASGFDEMDQAERADIPSYMRHGTDISPKARQACVIPSLQNL